MYNIFIRKKSYLGGLSRDIAKFPEKIKIGYFLDYLEDRAKKLKNLIVFTNTEATVELVENFKPDLIVNATGSRPLLPPIKGLHEYVDKENSNVFSIFGMMKDMERLEFEGKEIVIIGGGAVGLDIVEFFVERGVKVSIVERLSLLGKYLDYVTRISMMSIIKHKGVNVYTNTSLMEVKEDRFIVELENKEIIELKFDYGFVCLGMVSEKSILSELEDNFEEKGVPVVNIGDSLRPRKILEGVEEGRCITNTLEKMKLFHFF